METHQETRQARIYGRFSSSQQKDGISKQEQIEGAKDYAKKMGFKIIAEPYFDEGVSGKAGLNLEKELGRYRREAKEGEILLVHIQDRFGRQHPIKLSALLLDICEQGIEIHVWGENKIINLKNMQDMGGHLSTYVSSATGFQENQRKITRINDVFKDTLILARKGIPTANLTKCLPQVFYWNESANKFETVPEIKSVIRRIFAEFNSGMGKTSIAQGLNKDGKPTLYKKTDQTIGEMKPWLETTIKKILYNESYKGTIIIKGERFNGLIPQIVSDDDFNKAQMLLLRYSNRHGKVSQATKTNNIFAGLGYCKHCGGTVNINVSNQKKKGKPIYYYRCKNARLKVCKYPHTMLNAKYVEYGFFKTLLW